MSDEDENSTQGAAEATDQNAISENSDAENQAGDDSPEQDSVEETEGGLAAGAGGQLKPFNPFKAEIKEASREEQAAYGVIKETAGDMYEQIQDAMMQKDVGDKPMLSQALNHLEHTMALVSTALRCK